jgi:hypothetical protein
MRVTPEERLRFELAIERRVVQLLTEMLKGLVKALEAATAGKEPR